MLLTSVCSLLVLVGCNGDKTTDTSSQTDTSADTDTNDTDTDETDTDDTDETDTDTEEPSEYEILTNLYEAATISEVSCTLENGDQAECYQLVFGSADVNFGEEGPYCPATLNDIGGLGVYDGATNPGFQVMKAELFNNMEADGYDIVDDNGNIRIQTALGGGPGGGGGNKAGESYCLAIEEQDDLTLTFLLPKEPVLLSQPNEIEEVEFIGISFQGAPINGQPPSVVERGGNIPSLHPCGGHPDPSGYFHWHFVAESMNTVLSAYGITDVSCDVVTQNTSALVGYAKDGYPIYAAHDANGQAPTDLDECNGHTADTSEYPDGVYHYHASETEAPSVPPCVKGAAADNPFRVE